MKITAVTAIFGALLVSGGLLIGCGDDGDDNPNPNPDTGVDASTDTTPPVEDSGTPDSAPIDGGDAGPLDFAEFVKGLIKTETKSDNQPTTVDDKTFVDKQDQSQFTELFP